MKIFSRIKSLFVKPKQEEKPITKISQEGIELIKMFEGFRHKAYQCSAGVWTIGYGFTKNVRKGDTITLDEAEKRLIKELELFEECVKRVVKIKLTQNEFDALVSFTFNIGCRAFAMSSLASMLNAGKLSREEISNQFLRWNKVDGKVVRGLTARREKERELFLRK